ncbi:MAG TPA: DUF1269 domain-containing protein [Thermomicrobiales bacterium]|jgi:uncharacterized membrane protein
MNDEPMTALFAVYPNRAYADAAVAHLRDVASSSEAFVHGVAVVTKDLDGKVTAEEVGAQTGKRGLKRGAAIGAVVGVIFPPSILAASVAGAGIGGVIGHFKGDSDTHRKLQALAEHLDRGHTGVIVLVEDAETDRVAERLVGYEKLHRVRLDRDTLTPTDASETTTPPD